MSMKPPGIDPSTDSASDASQQALGTTLAYHERTKHHPGRFAQSLGYLDWESQPDPFLRFAGARRFSLEFKPIGPLPRYESAFVLSDGIAAPLDLSSVSQLFYDSLALSAWKEASGARWALRVNPSSGNLHPTEGYLVTGPQEGLHDGPGVYHYAPRTHELELRAELPREMWRAISEQLPRGALLVGLSSIRWRESWKYGERAFRYCNHDVGHAIACVSVAAAGLGWDARLLEGVVDGALATLLGLDGQGGAEEEHPDCLIAVFPQSANCEDGMQRKFRLAEDHLADLRDRPWFGQRNVLSKDHHDWPTIDGAVAATEKHEEPSAAFWSGLPLNKESLQIGESELSLRKIVHQRRSAVAFDGRTGITRDAFYQILRKAMPGPNQIPFTALPWRPRVDLLLYVHRVESMTPGLYVMMRDPSRREALQRSMDARFTWSECEGCPPSLELFFLEECDARRLAQRVSCDQAIAADGVFAAAMLCEYREPLEAYGPWFYRRLYWETGLLGQQLYLEAEASGIRATGIGCFFDELSHQVFGLEGDRFQVLYHFTVGAAVDDERLQTHPPYADHRTRVNGK